MASKRSSVASRAWASSCRTSPASSAVFDFRSMSKMAPCASAVLRSSLRALVMRSAVSLASCEIAGFDPAGNCELVKRKRKLRSFSTELAAALRPSKVKFSWLRYGTCVSSQRMDDGLWPLSTRSRSVKKLPRLLEIPALRLIGSQAGTSGARTAFRLAIRTVRFHFRGGGRSDPRHRRAGRSLGLAPPLT